MGELAKAKLIELRPSGDDWTEGDHVVEVQFNPASLRVSYANQLSGGDQAGASARQFTGQSTTKMTLELWFDTTLTGGDVRELTGRVAFFIRPRPARQGDEEVNVPPRMRLLWGSFLFDGQLESIEETLEFFSEDGVPLRASLGLSVSEQAFQFTVRPSAGRDVGGDAGRSPLAQARQGDTMQSLSARVGASGSWQALAESNGIENPRILAPGQVLRIGKG